jgi:ABC-type amino acid transport substrate-binding protein
MPIRLLMMVVGYVAVCVAIFKFWPQSEGDVVVATQKTVPAAQVQPADTTTQNQATTPTQPAVETANVQPVQPTQPAVQPTSQNVAPAVAKEKTSQERLISSADRMALLEVWTIIEECRLNRCESMNLANVSLNFIPDEVKDLRRLSTLIVGKDTSNIDALEGMRNIRILNLNDSQVQDIQPASALNGLKFLEISNTEISDLSPLVNLGALEHIDLAKSQVGSIAPLKDLVNLRYLNASNTNITEVSALDNMFEMQELILNDTGVADLSALSALDKLRRVEAARTNVSFIPDLHTNVDLELVDLSETNVVDLTPLAALDNLSVLNLSGTKIQDISVLADLPRLRELDLTNTRLGSLDALNDMNNLQVVYLSSVPPDSIDVLSELRTRGVSIEQQQDTRTDDNVAANNTNEVSGIRILTGSDYAPYVGEALLNGGYSTDLITQAFGSNPESDEINYETVNDWGTHLKPLLSGGSYDLAYPWYRPDCSKREFLGENAKWRCDNLRFSKPLHEVVVGAYAPVTIAGNIATPEDAIGMRICRPSGFFTHDLEAMGLTADKYTRLSPTTATECFEDMRDGRADLVVLNAETAEGIMDQLGITSQMNEVISMSSVQTLHVIGMRKNQRTRLYLRQLDIGLDALQRNGDLTRIMESHL